MLGSFLSWLGGGFNRMAATAAATGIFFVLYGGLPWEFVVDVVGHPAEWLLNGWVRLGAIIIGLALIFISLRWNMWSRRQNVVNELAEMLSSAIGDLLNRPIKSDIELGSFDSDFQTWCEKIKSKLEDHPSYFSKADIIHFERLGKVSKEIWGFAYRANETDTRHNHLLNMLSLKFDRLRDIINWTQQRTR